MRLRMGALALFWVVSATAAPTPDSPLKLGQAIALVLENNPQLQAADFDNRAAAARVRQQSQTAPWQLGLEVDRLAGTGQARGLQAMETTLSLGRVLELGDKPRLRGDLASLQAGLLRHDQDARRLDLLAETALRFLAIARAQAEAELAARQVALIQRTRKAVERRVAVGKAPKAELSRVVIDLARARLALEETEHVIATGRRHLAVLWGAFEPGFSAVAADLTRLADEPSLASLEQALVRNPALARLATVERLADARRRLATARRTPNLDLAAGLRHFNDKDDLGLTLSLRVPLGSRGRADPYVEEARLLAEREPLLARDRRLALRATLFGLHQELLHDRDRLHTLSREIIPAAERALADYSRGYDAGRYSLLELTQAQETLLQARLEALDAATDHHQNRIQIDRLVGAGLADGARP